MSFEQIKDFQYRAIVVNLLRVAAAVFAAVVVKRITARQESLLATARVVDS